MVGKVAALAIAAGLLASVNAQADPIVIKGSKFFYKTNGSQFFIRGVDYQQNPNYQSTSGSSSDSYSDPLADAAGCQRDLPYLQKLRTNTIRVYAIDPTKEHDTCMNLFNNAGIYVVADLSAPVAGASIDRNDPAWTLDTYNRYTQVIDIMANYTNTLGFFAGNEVSNAVNNTDAQAFVKAAVRDMKAYIKSKNYRPLGIGYATSDDQYIRFNVANYMNCGTQDTSVDFFGYNVYEWCKPTDTYSTSGIETLTNFFSNYTVPPFWAEYGCNTDPPRKFPDTQPLFSDPMDKVWSGGLVYEYFQDTNDYGLVSLSGGSVQTISDFNAYSSAVAKVNPTGVNSASYTPSNTALANCPAVVSVAGTTQGWLASPTLPPSPNNQLCECALQAASCVANSAASNSADIQGAILDYICGNDPDSCNGISGNGTTGVYGAYSMCTGSQKLTLAMNAYYTRLNQNPQACGFSGNASVVTPNLSSSCSAQVSQAGGALGTGTVSGGANGGSSSSAANNVAMPPFDFGVLAVGIYTVVAAMSGVGLFLL